jgi:hypothetical protein
MVSHTNTAALARAQRESRAVNGFTTRVAIVKTFDGAAG